MNHSDLWKKILSHLSHSIDAHRFESMFRPVSVEENNNPKLLSLSSPNYYIGELLEKQYKNKLLATAKLFSPLIEEVRFSFSSSVPVMSKSDVLSNVGLATPLQINKRYTLDTFIVGPNNQFARSASVAVANNPGKTKFNPLLIYGDAGLGKTHLLQSIGNFVISKNPTCNVVYVTAEEFYLSYIDAIKNNSIKKFSSQFRFCDILLMDDIQYLSSKESSQEEFFHIFNELHKQGKQIVLTSDHIPNELKGIQERLISRFKWGLCVDIQAPNFETRVAILKKKAEDDNLNIPENVLYYIAENVSSNIRDLEGIVIKLLAYASITKSDISLELVKSVLSDTFKSQKSKISIDTIIEAISIYYKIPVNKIREKDRRKEVAQCRQVGMYIAKTLTAFSLKTIGLNFGGRDHSTVIHSIKNIENMRHSDQTLAKDIDYIISSIK